MNALTIEYQVYSFYFKFFEKDCYWILVVQIIIINILIIAQLNFQIINLFS